MSFRGDPGRIGTPAPGAPGRLRRRLRARPTTRRCSMLPVPARFAVSVFGLAAGVCALVLVGGAAAQGATTLTFKELTRGSTFMYVDNAPASKTKGEPAASAGDVIVFTNPLTNAGKRIGRLYMHCTVVVPAPAANRA